MADFQGYTATPPLGANMHYCSGCGRPVHDTAVACPNCGAAQPAMGTKSRIAAALLALFLGGIGVHKFYLGQVGWGFVYLLFCWTFVPAVVAFVEFIIYLTMSDAAFAAKYH
ncbi:MAG: TM2 domain-containing protein [Devosia sp.]|nr:TM2 domain-containing protein [Devosia sp.]